MPSVGGLLISSSVSRVLYTGGSSTVHQLTGGLIGLEERPSTNHYVPDQAAQRKGSQPKTEDM
ncbi:hypothetical protein RP20_CCG028359 [Aedes albopictus]|nr:hypothetical protein RP20_CCG028359 [Aedes albopictus]